MKINISNDHRGLEIKDQIKKLLEELGHECIDFGTCDKDPVDYPDMVYDPVVAVANKQADRAILACATGIGMCIAANKIKGIRAVLCYDEWNAKISRTHNDANVLCLAADFIGPSAMRRIVEVWLASEFTGGRHQRRIEKIDFMAEGNDPRKMQNNQKETKPPLTSKAHKQR